MVNVDGRTIGSGKPGPVTQHLLSEFRKLVEVEGVKAFEVDDPVGGLVVPFFYNHNALGRLPSFFVSKSPNPCIEW